MDQKHGRSFAAIIGSFIAVFVAALVVTVLSASSARASEPGCKLAGGCTSNETCGSGCTCKIADGSTYGFCYEN